MSYHSFRNIGFVFTDTEAGCRKWRELFSGYDPEKVNRLLGFPYDASFVYVDYLGRSYRLRRRNGVLEKRMRADEVTRKLLIVPEGGEQEETPVEMIGRKAMEELRKKRKEGTDPAGNYVWTEELFMNEALVVYHILGDISDDPGFAGEWVPEWELDPVKIRSGNRMDPVLGAFASDFSGRINELREACEKHGGVKFSGGDLAYEFRPFPQIPVRLIFWEEDEEFSARVQVLVDRRAVDYMHFEAVGCMIADVLEMLGGGEKR